ncbi:MAG: ornithine cyclodeaminase family protein [Allosphingosinicella sp.]|uniref:ornithine cyclodeaminase family protein n=1 Tax=Allosphingosinicella sp. TaxID=2823234 RepID=UPI00393C8243
MNLPFIDAEEVAARLPYSVCIPLMKEAMTALSAGRTRQLLRSILDLPGGRAFGVMPGALDGGAFGAKLISVFPGKEPSHQGLVVLFDPDSGAPSAVIEAGELTAIRTAAASAAATDALARPDATRLAILGTGEQARRHVEAIREVRAIDRVAIWGRDRDRAAALAESLGVEPAATVDEAVAGADIVCAVTAAEQPILFDVPEGAHVNAVGSSRDGPVEIAPALVARCRFFADHAEGVRVQGAEFRAALAAGLIGEGHLLGEIGQVFAGTLPGRTSPQDVTIYKSLGSIVQDLAAAAFLVGGET